jgi:16S rRNA (adenine1518-N6/adenine1519-N6)-dimethyltransferase
VRGLEAAPGMKRPDDSAPRRSPPLKKWGQNFLRNPSAAARIVDAVAAEPGELIVEIGPGEGALTRDLLERYDNDLLAIEIDPRLADSLRTALPRAEVVNADALEIDLPLRPFRAVGNLPYNVGTPILRRLVASPHCRRGVFMLQKEVADRLTATAGSEEYGYLTLYVELFASARVLMTLEPGSFFPRPKVRSAVVVLDPRPAAVASAPARLIAVISAAFRMRRKTLVNNLTSLPEVSREAAFAAVAAAGLDPNVRAEQMTLADFDRLTTALG